MKNAYKIMLGAREHTRLEKWSTGRMSPMRVMIQAQIALLAPMGMENKAIAAELGIGRAT